MGVFSSRKDAASYSYQKFNELLDGDEYRFLVIHSSKLDGRKARSLEGRLHKKESLLAKEIKQKMKETYACLPA